MRKIFAVLIVSLLVFSIGCASFTDKVSIKYPNETGATAYYNPKSGAMAGGINHSVVRGTHADLPKLSVDIDGTLAQEVNEDKDTLMGVGLKANYNIKEEAGFSFLPSLGITAMNDFKKFNRAEDVLKNYELWFYGTILQYKGNFLQ